jgi:hypothetical protein
VAVSSDIDADAAPGRFRHLVQQVIAVEERESGRDLTA